MSYESEYQRSLEDPAGFWEEKAREIEWFRFPESILSTDERGAHRWYAGGKLNSAWLALDRHVEAGRGDQAALIYDSPVTGSYRSYSFAELTDAVARFGGVLSRLGVSKGDRVVIYMPMVPEAAIAMLACARIGAIHSVVFGGFASRELAMRIDDAMPKIVLSASCGIEFDRVIAYKPLLDEAIAMARHKVQQCVILQREQMRTTLVPGRDLDWHELEAAASRIDPVEVDAIDPLYILYTSGTTGKPKGVLRDNGGHAVALNYSMSAVYGVDTGDVFWAYSDVGWVVGHSYIVYGPLTRGCTSIMFEGKPVRTPDAGVFWRVMQDHAVKSFFVAPTAFRTIKKEDPEGKLLARYDISSLQYLFLAGERLDPPTYFWLTELVGVPVLDHWWQTETGWAICANMAGLGLKESKPGSVSLPVPGYDLRILDDDGAEVAANVEGNVVLREPLPPGSLPTVWGDHERFLSSYFSRFPGFYVTGDGGYRDEDGYVYIMGRVDDVINVAGHRLSTGEMEEVVAAHPAVAECAVIGVKNAERGQVPVGFVLLKDGMNVSRDKLQDELVQMVRQAIGPFANFKRVIVVERLPKTRSGKILRQIMRRIADGEEYSVPSTIDDPLILEEIAGALATHGA